MRAVTGCADAPLPALDVVVLDPYTVVGPQSKPYVVAWARGVTVPASVAAAAWIPSPGRWWPRARA